MDRGDDARRRPGAIPTPAVLQICLRISFDMPGDCIVFMENDDEDHDWYDQERGQVLALSTT